MPINDFRCNFYVSIMMFKTTRGNENRVYLSEMPVLKIKNGLRVGNLSSPHPFTFEDDSVLGACDRDRSDFFSVISGEEAAPSNCGRYNNIVLKSRLSDEVVAQGRKDAKNADVVLVPLMFLQAMKEQGLEIGKFRTVRMVSRTEKKVRLDAFCV